MFQIQAITSNSVVQSKMQVWVKWVLYGTRMHQLDSANAVELYDHAA